MASNIRRPWWAFLFAFTLIALTSLTFPCTGYCQEGAFDGDQKTEYYQQVENGASVWLNPGERYVPGSLRQTNRQQHYAPPSYHQPMPAYAPPAYSPPVYAQPQYVPQPYYPQWQPNYTPQPYRQPPAPYGIDFGAYRRDCDTCGVKIDGLSDAPNYRNWSERRGAMAAGDAGLSGPNSLNQKRQVNRRE